MSLTVHPDPQEPAGGFAFLELPGGMLGDDPVRVAVMEVYGEKWLAPAGDAGDAEDGKTTIGDGNWQGERHDFGLYDVHRHDGADWVRIGPEIVNKIEEYTPLRIWVGDHAADVTWPDNVPPRAGAAVLGGLMPTARTAPASDDEVLVGKPPEPPEPPEDEDDDDPVPVPSRWRRLSLLFLLGVLIGAVVFALWLWMRPNAPAPVADDTCTAAALASLDGFVAAEKAIRACGDRVSADTVLKIVEDAAERDDADALVLFGTLYDGADLDERIENVIGLSFEHDAAQAAEYYSRAQKAGSDAATARLAATCAQLAGSNETLAKGAYDDFCS